MDKNYGRWPKLPILWKSLSTKLQSDAISDFRMTTIAVVKKFMGEKNNGSK